jgi:hypothetical protein
MYAKKQNKDEILALL